jgi:hypothetical protein
MPEIVKPQIGQFRLQARGIPSAVRQLVAYRVTAEREAKAPVLSDLFSQHSNSISIERNASRRAILGLVQPCRLSLQIDA